MACRKKFIFPTLPRIFKNIEVIGEAVRLLQERGISSFEVLVTLDGSENKYAQWLRSTYGHLPNLKFIGRQEQVPYFRALRRGRCLDLPVEAGNLGLPITEFKQTGKPVFVADLPYGHETTGDYEKAFFFNPMDGTCAGGATRSVYCS